MTGAVSYDTYRMFMTKEYGTGFFSKHGKGTKDDKIAAVARALNEITGVNIGQPGHLNSEAIIEAASKIFIGGKPLRASLDTLKKPDMKGPDLDSAVLEIAGKLENVFDPKNSDEKKGENGLSFWDGNEVKAVGKNTEDIEKREKKENFNSWYLDNIGYAVLRIPEVLDGQIASRYSNDFLLKKYVEFNAGLFENGRHNRNEKINNFLDDLVEWKINNTKKIGHEANVLPGYAYREAECNNIIWHYSKQREMDTKMMNMLDVLQKSGKGNLLDLFNKKYLEQEQLINRNEKDYWRGKQILSADSSWKKDKPVFEKNSKTGKNIDITVSGTYINSQTNAAYTTTPLNTILQKEKDYLQNRIEKLADISVWEGIDDFNVRNWKRNDADKENKELLELENLQKDLEEDLGVVQEGKAPKGCSNVWKILIKLNNTAKEKINKYKDFVEKNNKELDEIAKKEEERRRLEENQKIRDEEHRKVNNSKNQEDNKRNNNINENGILNNDVNINNININNINVRKGLNLVTKKSLRMQQDNIVEANLDEDEKRKLNQKLKEDQKDLGPEELKKEKREENNEQTGVKSEDTAENKNEEIIDNIQNLNNIHEENKRKEQDIINNLNENSEENINNNKNNEKVNEVINNSVAGQENIQNEIIEEKSKENSENNVEKTKENQNKLKNDSKEEINEERDKNQEEKREENLNNSSHISSVDEILTNVEENKENESKKEENTENKTVVDSEIHEQKNNNENNKIKNANTSNVIEVSETDNTKVKDEENNNNLNDNNNVNHDDKKIEEEGGKDNQNKIKEDNLNKEENINGDFSQEKINEENVEKEENQNVENKEENKENEDKENEIKERNSSVSVSSVEKNHHNENENNDGKIIERNEENSTEVSNKNPNQDNIDPKNKTIKEEQKPNSLDDHNKDKVNKEDKKEVEEEEDLNKKNKEENLKENVDDSNNKKIYEENQSDIKVENLNGNKDENSINNDLQKMSKKSEKQNEKQIEEKNELNNKEIDLKNNEQRPLIEIDQLNRETLSNLNDIESFNQLDKESSEKNRRKTVSEFRTDSLKNLIEQQNGKNNKNPENNEQSDADKTVKIEVNRKDGNQEKKESNIADPNQPVKPEGEKPAATDLTEEDKKKSIWDISTKALIRIANAYLDESDKEDIKNKPQNIYDYLKIDGVSLRTLYKDNLEAGASAFMRLLGKDDNQLYKVKEVNEELISKDTGTYQNAIGHYYAERAIQEAAVDPDQVQNKKPDGLQGRRSISFQEFETIANEHPNKDADKHNVLPRSRSFSVSGKQDKRRGESFRRI